MDPGILLAGVIAASPPLLLAVLGETLTEKAGVLNLSLDGTLCLSAMAGFAAACETGSVTVGFAAALAVGALAAGIVAGAGLALRQSQVAVGFVLALLGRDLAYVLGNAYARRPGPQVTPLPIPGLSQLPGIGPVLFSHNPVVYLSLLLVAAVWFFLFRTQPGLQLRGLGDRPRAAAARGIPVARRQYQYALVGGALVGAGGAAFSLLVKPGWGRPCGIEGTGWIVLAIVIFGNWRPVRAALGALFFTAMQIAAPQLQALYPNLPTQIIPSLPFPIMILALLAVTAGEAAWVDRLLLRLPDRLRCHIARLRTALIAAPPGGLGKVDE
jgi:ABC-type uncharacterized transport system permease subunit